MSMPLLVKHNNLMNGFLLLILTKDYGFIV